MKKLLIAVSLLSLIAVPMLADSAPDGASLFKTKCAACHGADGKGQTGMGKAQHLRDLGSADVQKQTDADLGTIISKGKGKMPAYSGKLTDAEIQAVVKFIRSLKK